MAPDHLGDGIMDLLRAIGTTSIPDATELGAGATVVTPMADSRLKYLNTTVYRRWPRLDAG